MPYETYLATLERALAAFVVAFGELPDLYLREEDLHAALFHALQREALFTASYPTRDGRRTGLLHREYPSLLAYTEGLELAGRPTRAYYDLALLSPGFVRSQPWAVVANQAPTSRAAPSARAVGEHTTPLLAALHVKLCDECTSAVLDELETDFYELVRAEPDALRRYLLVFARHWDPVGPLRGLPAALQRWAQGHPDIAMVFVQAYHDDVGRVLGGRYLGLWNHTAPLPPLDPGALPALRRTPTPLAPRHVDVDISY